MADSVRDSIRVAADADTVMGIVSDLAAYPQWQPDITSVEVLDTDDAGWATRARFVIDARILTVSCVLAYTYDEAGMHWHLVEGDGLERNDGSYLLQRLPDAQTEVTYVLEVEPTVSVPRPLRRRIAERIVTSALEGLKRRVEGAG